MQFTHHPDRIQAKRLKEMTQENLISSLRYVLYVCEDAINKETSLKIADFISWAEKEKYSSGFLFYAVKEIGKAIEGQSLERIQHCFELVTELGSVTKDSIIIGRHGNLPIGLFDFYSKTNDDVYEFRFVDVPVESDHSIRARLDQAFKLILETDLELHEEINEIVDEFFIFKTGEDNEKVVYSGSDFNKLGTVFVNEGTCNKDLYFLVDKIIHESAHQVLLSIMTSDEIVLNEDSERFPSPLRTGLRTMNGIYHAAFVLYRIACFF
ncbi:aKG-HExxH-type peptide beta-hydroxylase [Dickeya oryzae]